MRRSMRLSVVASPLKGGASLRQVILRAKHHKFIGISVASVVNVAALNLAVNAAVLDGSAAQAGLLFSLA
jgi:K+-transporting ATPase c subunit